MSVFTSVLSPTQAIKKLLSRLLRLRSKEILFYEILETARQEGFTIGKITSSTFEICDRKSSLRYILRKNTSDLQVFNQVVIQEEYSTIHSLIKQWGKAQDIRFIIDCGANIGMTALYLGNVYPQAKILAIEPSSDNYKALVQNTEFNNQLPITPLLNAIWTEQKKLSLSNTFRDGQGWSLSVRDTVEQGDVDAITLQELLSRERMTTIDILKIDIEGSEKKLLSDSTFLSTLNQVRFLAIELHEEAIEKIDAINILQSIGFDLTYKGETLFGANKKYL